MSTKRTVPADGWSGPITIGADHPAWRAIDDDDWDGATFGNYLRSIRPGAVVTLVPPDGAPASLVIRMRAAFERVGCAVKASAHSDLMWLVDRGHVRLGNR